MRQVNKPHDMFTRSMLSEKHIAIAFLEKFLPESTLKLLELSGLEVTTHTYVSERLDEQLSDIVYRVKTKDNKECEIAVLIEHKSYVDKYVSVQLLGYIHQALVEKVKNKETLIPTIPILSRIIHEC